MSKCSHCGDSGHNAAKHDVRCRICGQVRKFPIEEVKEAREVFKCGDVEAHEATRNIWGLSHEEAQRVKVYGIQRTRSERGH